MRRAVRLLAWFAILCLACGSRPAASMSSPTPSNSGAQSLHASTHCLVMKPGAEVTSDAATCDVRVRAQLAGVNCTKVTQLPFGVVGAAGTERDVSGQATIPISAGRCHLSSQAMGRVTELRARDESPVDVAVVADVALTKVDGIDVGVNARCAQFQCVAAHLVPTSTVAINEIAAGGATTDLDDNNSFSFTSGGEYRLVLVARGAQVAFWLDGTLGGAATTHASQPGYTSVFLIDIAQSGSATVDVTRFYVYSLASG